MSFSLTRKTDYALVALAALAERADTAGGPMSARQIADTYDLPAALLTNALKDLLKAGIVCSRRGAGGGYLLCRDPERISLLRVVEALEGPVKVALCCEDESHEADGGEPCIACRVLEKCPIVLPMQRLDDLVHEFLSQVKLKDLITTETTVSMTLEGAPS